MVVASGCLVSFFYGEPASTPDQVRVKLSPDNTPLPEPGATMSTHDTIVFFHSPNTRSADVRLLLEELAARDTLKIRDTLLCPLTLL
jgi:hypothetical protein